MDGLRPARAGLDRARDDRARDRSVLAIGEELINNILWPPVLFPGPAPVAQLDRATAF